MGVSKNYPKKDGENNGNPYSLMDDLETKNPLFCLETSISSNTNYNTLVYLSPHQKRSPFHIHPNGVFLVGGYHPLTKEPPIVDDATSLTSFSATL